MTAISNSEISMWRRCPRKWYLGYYLGAGLAEEPATGNMQLGSRVHAALQGWTDPALQLDPLDVLDVIYAQAADQHPEHAGDLSRERELARIMTSGLAGWLAESTEWSQLQVIAAEQEVTVPFEQVPGVQLRVKLDTRVRDADGHELFLDWKTSDNFERHEMLALDPQFRFYSLVMALEAAGRTVPGDPVPVIPMGGIVCTLRRCKRTARSTPPYYAWDQFRYSPDEVLAEQEQVAQVCREIMAARALLDAADRDHGRDLAIVNQVQRTACRPAKMPHDCRWSCPFVQLCPMMDDGSDWPGALLTSGRWAQRDPYARYADDVIGAVRASLAGNVSGT